MIFQNKSTQILNSLFLISIMLIYPFYYLETLQIFGLTYAKVFELTLILVYLFISLITFLMNPKLNKIVLYFILFYLFLFIKLIIFNDNIIEFLKKEYFIFYWFIFFIIGYSVSTSRSYMFVLKLVKRIFLFIVVVGVVFFLLGIDYKLQLYSQAEGMFYHPFLGVNRATSFVYNPQIFGMFCVMTALLYKNSLTKLFAYLGLFFSFSRSSILAYLFSNVVASKKKKYLLISFMIILNLFVLGTFFQIGGFFDRFFNINTYLEDVRVAKFAVALYFITSNINNLFFGMPYNTNIALDGISFSDNTYLYVAIQGGLSLLLIFILLLYKIFQKIKNDKNLLIIFIASLISAFFTISFAYISFNLFFFLIGSYYKYRSFQNEKSINS